MRPSRKGISPDCVPATSCLSAPLSLPIVSTASELLEDGRKNPNGFLQSSDLTLTLSGNKIEKIVYTRDGQKTEIEDNTPCVVTLDAFITDGGDGYDASLFKGYEIPEFDNLGIISTDAFMDYLKGIKKPITVESTHMPVISK